MSSLELPFVVVEPTLVPQVGSATIQIQQEDEEAEIELASTTTPTATPVPVVAYAATPEAPEDIKALIYRYAGEYGVDPEKMIRIAKCESNYRVGAVSPSGRYVGLYQFVDTTWRSNRNAMGFDPDPALRANAEEAVKTAAFKMGRDGYGAWPVCGKR